MDFEPTQHGAQWGAEPAGARAGANLAPGIWTLYVDGEIAPVLKAAKLRKDDRGNVELRTRFWAEEAQPNAGDCAPALLTIADLIATRDRRCLDAAKELREAMRIGPE